MSRWLAALTRLVVPTAWRETLIRDLHDEAVDQRRGQLWLAWQTICAGARLRFAFSGDGLVADVRMVVRSLMRAKGFAVAAILTFALGIGANIAVFSVIDRLMFRPLPYTDPDRLVHVHLFEARDPTTGAFAMVPTEFTSHIQKHSTTIEGFAWVNNLSLRSLVPAPGENPLRLAGLTANGLGVLGVRPVLGRDFNDTDAGRAWNDEAAVLLTYEVWQRRYGGSTDVLSLTWATRPTYRVVGILPPGFILPSSLLAEPVDGVFVQGDQLARGEGRPGEIRLAPFARLRPGVPLEAAQAEVAALLAQPSWASALLQNSLTTQQRAFEEGGARNPPVYLQPLQSGLTMFLRPYLWLISAAVWIVLCAACVNLATLLVARGRSRQRDAAIRAAIGAAPSRLVRLAVIESIVVCTVSSLVALAVCVWAERALLAFVPPAFEAFAVPPLDARIVALTIGITFMCAAMAGVLPALNVARVDVLTVLQRAERPGRLASLRGGAALLALQAVFGMVLVLGGATVVPGFIDLVAKSPGFEARDLFVLNVSHGGPTSSSTGDPNRLPRIRTVLDVLRGIPRVERADAALRLPFGGGVGHREFWQQRGITGGVWAVSAGMFETLDTPILAGRAFTNAEIDAEAPVAIVSVMAARALWPGEPIARAVNKSIDTGHGTRTVVGVVADLRTAPPEAPAPALYLPVTARELPTMSTAMAVAVRMAPGAIPDPALLTARLNEHFPSAASVHVTSVREQLAPMLDRPRFLAMLMGGLAVIALLLVAIGLYALASFEVARRRYEIGVRLALGSSVRAVRRRIVRLALAPVLVGAAIGGLVVWWSAGLTQTVITIPEMNARDPWAYAGASVLVLLAAVLAAALPALRAGRIDPVTVIREP